MPGCHRTRRGHHGGDQRPATDTPLRRHTLEMIDMSARLSRTRLMKRDARNGTPMDRRRANPGVSTDWLTADRDEDTASIERRFAAALSEVA